jgi:uncharacterized protein (DUF1778 family)
MQTLTMEVDNSIYKMIELVANKEKKNISNFLNFAIIEYLISSQYVDNIEMNDILDDKELVKNLENGFKNLEKGEYTIV